MTELPEGFKPDMSQDYEGVYHTFKSPVNNFVQDSDYAIYLCPVGEPGTVLHVVFYQNEPTDRDIELLFEELYSDEELGFLDKDFEMIAASPDVVRQLKEQIFALEDSEYEMKLHEQG